MLPHELNELLGMRVILSPSLVKYRSVRRTWGERLLSRPWRPFQKFRQVVEPWDEIIRHDRTLYMHPATWQVIQAQAAGLGLHPERNM